MATDNIVDKDNIQDQRFRDHLYWWLKATLDIELKLEDEFIA